MAKVRRRRSAKKKTATVSRNLKTPIHITAAEAWKLKDAIDHYLNDYEVSASIKATFDSLSTKLESLALGDG